MENEIISTIPQLSRSSPLEEHMLADQYHKGVDEEGAYFNEGRGNPRENEVQMVENNEIILFNRIVALKYVAASHLWF